MQYESSKAYHGHSGHTPNHSLVREELVKSGPSGVWARRYLDVCVEVSLLSLIDWLVGYRHCVVNNNFVLLPPIFCKKNTGERWVAGSVLKVCLESNLQLFGGGACLPPLVVLDHRRRHPSSYHFLFLFIVVSMGVECVCELPPSTRGFRGFKSPKATIIYPVPSFVL